MRHFRTPMALALTLLFFCVGFSQSSKVRSSYMKDVKRTKVETFLLYVMNTPDQFVELQLHAVYKGEKPVKPAEQLGLTIFSLAKKAQFRGDTQELFATTGGDRWRVGTGTRTGFKGDTNKGVESFLSENRPDMGMQVPFPQSAAVRNAGGDVNGLTMEWVEINIKPEQLSKLAAASEVRFQLGSTTFALNEEHLQILRDFVSQLTPQP